MFELLMKNESDWIDITQLVGGLEWAENLDNIGMTISFSVPCDDSQKYLQNIDLRAGRNVKLVSDGEEINRFLVTSVDINQYKRSVSGTDLSYYFKNKCVLKFSKCTTSEAIKQLCDSAGIKLVECCKLNKVVDKIYISNYADVLKELLAEQRKSDVKDRYCFMDGEGLHICEYPTTFLYVDYKPADNIASYSLTRPNVLGEASYSYNIDSTYNAVMAVIKNGEDNLPTKTYIAKNDESIKLYGQLTDIVEVTNADAGNIVSIANNELKIKNRLTKTFNVSMIGSTYMRKGEILQLTFTDLNISGNYRIKSITNKLENGIHLVDLELQDVDEEVKILNYEDYKTEDKETYTNADGEEKTLDVSKYGLQNGGVLNKNFSTLYRYGYELVKKKVPYKFGGKSASGMDCSGFVSYVIKKVVPSFGGADASGLYAKCTTITKTQAMPGDLIFYKDTYKKKDKKGNVIKGAITHVMVFIGNGKMMGAEGKCCQIAGVRKNAIYGRFKG